MFSHSGKWRSETGPRVEVGLFAGRDWQPPQEIPRFQALIDTGAEETCISRTAAASLGIRDNPIGLRSVVSPSGRARLNVYEVHLVFFITQTFTQMLEMEVVEPRPIPMTGMSCWVGMYCPALCSRWISVVGSPSPWCRSSSRSKD